VSKVGLMASNISIAATVQSPKNSNHDDLIKRIKPYNFKQEFVR